MSPDSQPAEAGGGDRRPRVGYLGPEGTFTEEALLSSTAPGAVEPVATRTIYDTILALARGEVEWAVVPIENSLDGSVSVTLDLLGSEDGGLRIVGEALLSVRHSLIASGVLELSEIETILTHPQVPGQCERFLRRELAHATVLPATSTAEAVRTVAEGRRRGQAALGTVLAAEIYGATVLREGVQDRDDNETRFVWVARAREGAGDGVVPAERDLPGEERGVDARSAAAPTRGGGMEDVAGVLGGGSGQPRLARSLPGRVRTARDQPDEDRVPAKARSDGQLHVLRGSAGPGERPGDRGGGCWARADLRAGARARLLPPGGQRHARRAGGRRRPRETPGEQSPRRARAIATLRRYRWIASFHL